MATSLWQQHDLRFLLAYFQKLVITATKYSRAKALLPRKKATQGIRSACAASAERWPDAAGLAPCKGGMRGRLMKPFSLGRRVGMRGRFKKRLIKPILTAVRQAHHERIQ